MPSRAAPRSTGRASSASCGVANRSRGMRVGRMEWVGSFEAYIRRSADLLVEGWTVDDDDPLTPPAQALYAAGSGRGIERLDRLVAIERELWWTERAAHNTSRLSPSRRLPVYLNAIDPPALAAEAALQAVETLALASEVPQPRERGVRCREVLEIR